jgi:hypothetical protein
LKKRQNAATDATRARLLQRGQCGLGLCAQGVEIDGLGLLLRLSRRRQLRPGK